MKLKFGYPISDVAKTKAYVHSVRITYAEYILIYFNAWKHYFY